MHKLCKIHPDTIRDNIHGPMKMISRSLLNLPFKCPKHISTDRLAEERILLNRRWFAPSRPL